MIPSSTKCHLLLNHILLVPVPNTSNPIANQKGLLTVLNTTYPTENTTTPKRFIIKQTSIPGFTFHLFTAHNYYFFNVLHDVFSTKSKKTQLIKPKYIILCLIHCYGAKTIDCFGSKHKKAQTNAYLF